MSKIDKHTLKENYETACNAYVEALLSMWGLDGIYGDWVSDEVGGVYDYDGRLFLNMREIIFCVENKVAERNFDEWQEYCVRCAEYNLNTMCLESWCLGAPRVPQETFDHLDALKKELEEEVEKFNENNPY